MQFVQGQDCEDTEFKDYFARIVYWNDTAINEQKLYFPDSTLRIEYVRLAGDKRLRKDYFAEGRIKLSVETYQVYAIDSGYTEDLRTGELHLVVDSGYRDIFDGKYIEYHEPFYSKKDIPSTIGQFTNGMMTGKWQTEEGALGHLVTGTFNELGQLDGEYVEYYADIPTGKSKIKWKGQYGIVQVDLDIYDHAIPKHLNKKVERSERVGTWVRYNKDGIPIHTITYNWNK